MSFGIALLGESWILTFRGELGFDRFYMYVCKCVRVYVCVFYRLEMRWFKSVKAVVIVFCLDLSPWRTESLQNFAKDNCTVMGRGARWVGLVWF